MRKALVLAAAAALCLLATAPAQARKMSTTYTTNLSPKTATNPTGVNHTLTATVIRHTQNCDPGPQSPQIEPAQGVNVKFEVVSGPNAGLSGVGTTDLQGHAHFTYTSQTPGTDKLIATPLAIQNKGVCNPDAGPAEPSNTVEAIWVKAPGGGETGPSDDHGPLQLTINDVRVKEGNTDWSPATAATFTVKLSAPSSDPVTVEYATADGTATDAWDYAPAHDKLTFNPGEVTKTITISVRGDHLTEHDEDGQGIGTIIDDDPLPQT
jgi:hypothetical protein